MASKQTAKPQEQPQQEETSILDDVIDMTIEAVERRKAFEDIEWSESINKQTKKVSRFKKLLEFGGFAKETIGTIEADGVVYDIQMQYNVNLRIHKDRPDTNTRNRAI